MSRTLFPLGGYTKPQVRAMAAERGFQQLAQKTESQDICFLPSGDYREFLAKNVPQFERFCQPGDFLDMEGKVVGRHEGFPNYTIGQRKGLRVAFGTPRYVCALDAQHNTVTLGERDDLYRSELEADGCRFIDWERLAGRGKVLARIRYRSAAEPCGVEFDGEVARVRFDSPVWGVTPGQSIVMYQDGLVVGGGIIVR